VPCSGQTELFFREWEPEPTAAAKALCRNCPVQVECLTQAARRRERDGIAGGVSFRASLERHDGRLVVRPSEWAQLLDEHRALLESGGLHAVAAAVVSALRDG